MILSDFDFELPESRIALRPAQTRDSSRLMVILPDGRLQHRSFRDLPEYLNEGDMLLLNRTKVTPVRLTGTKPSGGRLEILLVKNLGGNVWEILSKGSYSGPLEISQLLSAEIEGGKRARLVYDGDLERILWDEGRMPIPPYIKREPDDDDKVRYQTVYARDPGSIAAPTAGLHFTEDLLAAIEQKGVMVRHLTLHVGTGTFTPIRADSVEDHEMASEYFEIEKTLVDEISNLRGRLVAVGTTATRAVEGLFGGRHSLLENGNVLKGSTDIFICPGYQFRAVSSLVTNFHLPRSTPLMLTAALAGRRRLLDAYAEALREGYRFFSYGDAMLIL